MAIAKVPPQVGNPFDYLGDQAEFGPALFTKLVPFSVHAAITIYEQLRDRIVNENIIGQMETQTEKLHQILSSINLPGSLQALEKPLGLPHSLVHHAEEIRQADAIGRIQRAFSDIDKLRNADISVFNEGKAILTAEEEEDQRLRRKYGTDRWSRPDSRSDPQGAAFWGQVAEIEGYFASSTSSDALVREKYREVQDLLEMLSGSDRALMDYVPSSRRMDIPEPLKPVIGRLRGAYNDVLRLESRRRKKAEALREKARTDDIKPDILKEAARLERTYPTTAIVPAHFEEFFEKRLDKLYDGDIEAVAKEEDEQDRLMTEVQRVNREFESQKKNLTSGSREREQALQRLDNAYYKYKEIVNNVDVGRKFYNDLSKVVGQNFRDPVKAWAAERRMDAKSLEESVLSYHSVGVFANNVPGRSTCRLSALSTSTDPQSTRPLAQRTTNAQIIPTSMPVSFPAPHSLSSSPQDRRWCILPPRHTFSHGRAQPSNRNTPGQLACGSPTWGSSSRHQPAHRLAPPRSKRRDRGASPRRAAPGTRAPE